MASDTQPKLPDYPLFDWLRFALASAVFLSHAGIIAWDGAGNLAVQVFFSLSGWLIGGILIDGDAKALPRFYFNRVTRIWIPYFCTVVALYALSAIRDPITVQWFKFLIYDVTFTHNWFALWPDANAALALMPEKGTGNHFWSIAVEEQFYLLAPLIVYASRIGRAPAMWGVLFAALLIIGQTNFASIAAGVCAASAQRRWGDWHTGRWPIVALSLGVITSAAALFQFYPYAAPFFAISAVMLTAQHGERTKMGIFFGGISYPLYLNAWIGTFAVSAIVHHVLPALMPVLLFLQFGAAVLAATTTYFLVDRRVMAARGGWYSNRIGLVAAITAYSLLILGLLFGTLTRTPSSL